MRLARQIVLATVVLGCISTALAQTSPEVFHFAEIDADNDGWIMRSEWNLSSADFKRLDVDFDNRISRHEFDHDKASDERFSPARFNALDVDGDGWLTRPESQLADPEFFRVDRNKDRRISRLEFESAAAPLAGYVGPRSMAWRAGYQRGIQDGLAAGRDDSQNGRGWNLEGRHEIEQADSGYTPDAGLRSDYQGGYLDGFQCAYREGYFSSRNAR